MKAISIKGDSTIFNKLWDDTMRPEGDPEQLNDYATGVIPHQDSLSVAQKQKLYKKIMFDGTPEGTYRSEYG